MYFIKGLISARAVPEQLRAVPPRNVFCSETPLAHTAELAISRLVLAPSWAHQLPRGVAPPVAHMYAHTYG